VLGVYVDLEVWHAEKKILELGESLAAMADGVFFVLGHFGECPVISVRNKYAIIRQSWVSLAPRLIKYLASDNALAKESFLTNFMWR